MIRIENDELFYVFNGGRWLVQEPVFILHPTLCRPGVASTGDEDGLIPVSFGFARASKLLSERREDSYDQD